MIPLKEGLWGCNGFEELKLRKGLGSSPETVKVVIGTAREVGVGITPSAIETAQAITKRPSVAWFIPPN